MDLAQSIYTNKSMGYLGKSQKNDLERKAYF